MGTAMGVRDFANACMIDHHLVTASPSSKRGDRRQFGSLAASYC